MDNLIENLIPKNTNVLQTLQNSMIRVIYGLKIQNRVNYYCTINFSYFSEPHARESETV